MFNGQALFSPFILPYLHLNFKSNLVKLQNLFVKTNKDISSNHESQNKLSQIAYSNCSNYKEISLINYICSNDIVWIKYWKTKTLSSSLFILSSLHLKVCFLLCFGIIFFHTLPISSWKSSFQEYILRGSESDTHLNISSRKLIVNAFFHRKWQSSKVLTAKTFHSLLLWKLNIS